MAGAIDAAVAGGAGASTGSIYRGSMLDIWEGKNEAGSWIFLDGYCWLISINIESYYARDWCAEDKLY